MSPKPAGATAERAGGAAPYQRHRPEHTLLYQIVEQYYPAFAALMAEQERPLPDYVQREFEDYLRCGRLEHGPLDFIARLAALVPKPRVNPTRYHGVFTPNSPDRAAVTPAKRGKGAKSAGLEEEREKTPAQRRAAMSLNAAPQTRLRHRHRDLCGLRRRAADHRLHRRPRGDQEDSHPHRQ